MASNFQPEPGREYRLVRMLNDSDGDPSKWYHEWYLIESHNNQGVSIGGPWTGEVCALDEAAKFLGDCLVDWDKIENGDGEAVVFDATVIGNEVVVA